MKNYSTSEEPDFHRNNDAPAGLGETDRPDQNDQQEILQQQEILRQLEILQQERDRQRKILVRVLAFVLAVSFILLAFNGILQLLGMPSYNLLFVSMQYAQDSQISHLRKSVVSVQADNRAGTGFFVNVQVSGNDNSNLDSPFNMRLLVTNDHIIQDARQVTIGLRASDKRQAIRWQRWPEADLALVWVEGEMSDLPDMALMTEKIMSGDALPAEGDPLTIIGNPLGLFQIVARAVYVDEVRSDTTTSLILIRGPIFRGNSGSPVLNTDGKVIGILAAIADDENQDPESAIGLVIPARVIISFLQRIDE